MEEVIGGNETVTPGAAVAGVTDSAVEKTPAELKAEAFKANPDRFFDRDEVIMAVLRDKSGAMGTLMGGCKRVEMEIALTRLQYKTFQLFQMMDMSAEMEREAATRGSVITAPGAVPMPPQEFARRKRR